MTTVTLERARLVQVRLSPVLLVMRLMKN